MTVTVPAEHASTHRSAARYDSVRARLIVALSLLASDIACFLLVDAVLRFGLGAHPLQLSALPWTLVHGAGKNLDFILLYAGVFAGVRYLAGDYSGRQLFWDSARATAATLLVGAVFYLVASLLRTPHAFPVSALAWFGLMVLLPACRQGTRYLLYQSGIWRLPTALFGTNRLAQDVYPALSRRLALGLDLQWIVPESADRQIPPSLSVLDPLVASGGDIAQTLIAAGCHQVVFVPDDYLNIQQNNLIDQFVGEDIRVAIVLSLRQAPYFGPSAGYLFGRDFLLLQVRNNLGRPPQRLLKRILDLVGAVLLILLLSPVMLALALLVKLEDGGPVIFTQGRVGRVQKDFRFWKFRTMKVDAESQMQRWETENPVLLAQYRESNFKLKADPRVTRIGAWLRARSLDELPQLFNVLLGDMSLVGPRPLLRRELADYGPAIKLYERVRPGMTGLWQIRGRSQTTFADRVAYDEWYIKNWAAWYDLAILVQTIGVILRAEGAY